MDIYYNSESVCPVNGSWRHTGERLDQQLLHLVPVAFSVVCTLSPVPTRFGTMTDNMVCHSLVPACIISLKLLLGLIRWKIVIHGFIDGYSRFVLGLRASGNNRANTVLELFEDIASVYGYPSRVRGDHGTENLLIAFRMEIVRGLNRGSYIWGRSVNDSTL